MPSLEELMRAEQAKGLIVDNAPKKSTELTTSRLAIFPESGKSVGFKDIDSGEVTWLPLSQITLEERFPKVWHVTVPDWLLAKKPELLDL